MKFGGSTKSAKINGSQNGLPEASQKAVHSIGNQQHDFRVLRLSDGKDACVEGLGGSFKSVENDFTRYDLDSRELGARNRGRQHFRNDSNWDNVKRERVKRFRFIICFLGLCAGSLALMSRALLSVTIVDMVKKDAPSIGSTEAEVTDWPGNDFEMTSAGYGAEEANVSPTDATTTTTTTTTTFNSSQEASSSPPPPSENEFEWSVVQQNTLLGSFHLGYIPSMLVSGGIADKYGAKYPLFVCVSGSFAVNFLTPHLASYSLYLLISSRVLLGILHGGLIPSLYDLFNKWLTLTETSIFVPLIKVCMSGGILMGSMIPGVMASFGYQWPHMFYLGSFLCFIWSIVWLSMATSTPQTNPLVKSDELHRIMRKKKPPAAFIVPMITVTETPLAGHRMKQHESAGGDKTNDAKTPDSVPWLLIITNRSVIVLTFVKFTYNLALEFWGFEMAVYLRKIHGASTTTISVIASVGALLPMVLLTPIGWSARLAVERKLFGFSRTSWRKIYQGLSNFSMAAIYLVLTFFGPDMVSAGSLIILLGFFWMFGAGGESMIPYDLSSRYPATIMGFSHAISVSSGLAIPAVCSLVLGDGGNEPERWNLLFLMIAGALGAGGLIFCSFMKAEPFLPGERQPKKVEVNSKK